MSNIKSGNVRKSSSVMSKARFNAFMGGESVASVMSQTPQPAVSIISCSESGTGVKSKTESSE